MIAVIAQARINSTRLPSKVLAPLTSDGMTVLEHVLSRVQRIPGIDVVVGAFPDEQASEPLCGIAESLGVQVYLGPEHDVLARYAGAAEMVGADIIMRVTCDCPLIDPEVCGAVLEALLLDVNADYASNLEPRSFPQGLDCEAFTMRALMLADRLATDPYDREHVSTWMRKPEAKLHRMNVRHSTDLSCHRWTVDYPEDLAFVNAVVKAGNPLGMEQTLAVLDEHPEFLAINEGRR